MQLDPDDIEQIATRVADLLRSTRPESTARYVDAATLADELGVERDWVYAHAQQLGAVRLGGPRGRLRFDRQNALASLNGGQEPAAKARPRTIRRSPRRAATDPSNLIPYEG